MFVGRKEFEVRKIDRNERISDNLEGPPEALFCRAERGRCRRKLCQIVRTVDDLVGVSRRNKPTKGIMDNVLSVAAMAVFVQGEQSVGGGSHPRGYTGCVLGRSIQCGDCSPGIMRR